MSDRHEQPLAEEQRIFDLEYRASAAPLTPAEAAEIRVYERRKAQRREQIRRIQDDEWGRAAGFPYYPRWALPALVAVVFVLSAVAGAGLAFITSRPATMTVHVMRAP